MNIFKSMMDGVKKEFFDFNEFFKSIADNDVEKFDWCLKNRIDSKNINHFNPQRYNALSYICEHNRVEFLDKILKFKPSTNIKNHEGKTPLFLLCEQKDTRDSYFGYRDIFFGDNIPVNDSHDKIEIITKLLNYGTDVNTSDYDKNTPLIRAIQNKYKDVALLLLKHGAHLKTNKASLD